MIAKRGYSHVDMNCLSYALNGSGGFSIDSLSQLHASLADFSGRVHAGKSNSDQIVV